MPKSGVWISPSRVRTPHFCKTLLSTKLSQPSWVSALKDKRKVGECLRALSETLYSPATLNKENSLSSQIRGNGEEASRSTTANLHTIDVAKPFLLNKGQDRFTKNSMRLAEQQGFHISGGGGIFINQDGSFTDGEREGERRQGEPHFHFLPAVPSAVTVRLRRPERPNMRHSAVMPITRIINFWTSGQTELYLSLIQSKSILLLL